MLEGFENWPVEDLCLVRDQHILEPVEESSFCVYCPSVDSVTFVSAAEYSMLKLRGVREIQSLPNQK
jgi:hypothetical protein